MYHIPIHLHLCTSSKALVFSITWSLYKSSGNVDIECYIYHRQRFCYFDPPTSTDMETAATKIREGCPYTCFRPWVLVSFSTPLNTVILICLYSVIFASAYRLSVLFSYSATDPTFTLAPTVGWTAIEMSAGITSACLPTMRPAFLFIARNLGANSSWLSIFREATSGVSQSAQTNINAHTGSANTSTAQRSHARAESGRSFYRLPDDSKSKTQDSDKSPVDVELRPKHGCVYTVSSVANRKSETESLSGDEIPLHSISVQKKITQIRD